MTYSKFFVQSGAEAEPEAAQFRPKRAGVGVIKGKWPAPEPESELGNFENLAPETEPLKFSRLYQPWSRPILLKLIEQKVVRKVSFCCKACLHDQNKSGFFGGPAFIQPVRAI